MLLHGIRDGLNGQDQLTLRWLESLRFLKLLYTSMQSRKPQVSMASHLEIHQGRSREGHTSQTKSLHGVSPWNPPKVTRRPYKPIPLTRKSRPVIWFTATKGGLQQDIMTYLTAHRKGLERVTVGLSQTGGILQGVHETTVQLALNGTHSDQKHVLVLLRQCMLKYCVATSGKIKISKALYFAQLWFSISCAGFQALFHLQQLQL